MARIVHYLSHVQGTLAAHVSRDCPGHVSQGRLYDMDALHNQPGLRSGDPEQRAFCFDKLTVHQR